MPMLTPLTPVDVARSIGSLVYDLPNSRQVGEQRRMYPLLLSFQCCCGFTCSPRPPRRSTNTFCFCKAKNYFFRCRRTFPRFYLACLRQVYVLGPSVYIRSRCMCWAAHHLWPCHDLELTAEGGKNDPIQSPMRHLYNTRGYRRCVALHKALSPRQHTSLC